MDRLLCSRFQRWNLRLRCFNLRFLTKDIEIIGQSGFQAGSGQFERLFLRLDILDCDSDLPLCASKFDIITRHFALQ